MIELYSCNSCKELRMQEEVWRKKYNTRLNMRRAHRTWEERYDQTKKKDSNPERKKKKREKVICECGLEIAKYTLCTHKKTPLHAERMEEIKKNGNAISLRHKSKYEEKIKCKCGVTISPASLHPHINSEKHISAMKNLGLLTDSKKEYDIDEVYKYKDGQIFCRCQKWISSRTMKKHIKSSIHILRVDELNKNGKITETKQNLTTCECGKIISSLSMSRHIKTQNHKKAMEKKDEKLLPGLSTSIDTKDHDIKTNKKESTDKPTNAYLDWLLSGETEINKEKSTNESSSGSYLDWLLS